MRCMILLCLTLVLSTAAIADDVADRVGAVVDRYANDDTLVVAAVQLDGVWVRGVQQDLATRFGDDAAEVVNHPGFAIGVGLVETLRSAGARELVVVGGIYDLSPSSGGLFVLTVENAEQATTVSQVVAGLLTQLPTQGNPFGPLVVDDMVLIAQQATLNRYLATTASKRGDLNLRQRLEELRAQGDEGPWAVALAAPAGDARRVIEACWPALPEPFAAADGQFVANDLEQFAASVRCPPEWEIRLSIDAANEVAAEKVRSLVDQAWQHAIRRVQDNKQAPAIAGVVTPRVESVGGEPAPEGSSTRVAEILKVASEVLSPTVDGDVASVVVSHDQQVVGSMVSRVVTPGLKQMQEAASRRPKLMQFKQMALAMHNFHDVVGHFPASAAVVGKQGKPLLSWRVAILPYIEESTLYNEFRYDEPWDSPYNLKLVERMPDVFADPLHSELAAEGKTTYQLPVNAQGAFPPAGKNVSPTKHTLLGREIYFAPGTSFRDIRDGTSATVMIVEVPAEDAVIWTQPADWEVDLARAWQQLFGDNSTGTATAALCDGSAHLWDAADVRLRGNLSKFLTSNGKEMIDR